MANDQDGEREQEGKKRQQNGEDSSGGTFSARRVRKNAAEKRFEADNGCAEPAHGMGHPMRIPEKKVEQEARRHSAERQHTDSPFRQTGIPHTTR